jgi:hypothetical protein
MPSRLPLTRELRRAGYVVATTVQDGRAVVFSTPSLIGASVLIAATDMLFTTRYPPGLF